MKKKDLIDSLQDQWRVERPELDTQAMGVVGRVLILAETMKKRANQTLSAHGLGYTDLDVLATLRRSGAPFELRPADLLKSVLIQSGSLTACLDRLQKADLITRVANEKDRRSLSVKLTDHGVSVVDKAIVARFEEAHDFISGLSAKEVATLETLLRKLTLADD